MSSAPSGTTLPPASPTAATASGLAMNSTRDGVMTVTTTTKTAVILPATWKRITSVLELPQSAESIGYHGHAFQREVHLFYKAL